MLDVCAGVIIKNNKVLLARRPQGSHLAGFWEFPGGKIEKGETPEECLKRELKEELAIEATVGDFICASEYDYVEKSIRLLAYYVEITGEPQLKAHDSLAWIDLQQIEPQMLAPADRLIAQEIKRDN